MTCRLLVSLLLLFAICTPLLAEKQVDDGVITDRVRQRLFSDPDVKGYTVDVETKQGIVTLSGTVETDRAKQKAEKLTRKVGGVKSVVNNLRVEVPRPELGRKR